MSLKTDQTLQGCAIALTHFLLASKNKTRSNSKSRSASSAVQRNGQLTDYCSLLVPVSFPLFEGVQSKFTLENVDFFASPLVPKREVSEGICQEGSISVFGVLVL